MDALLTSLLVEADEVFFVVRGLLTLGPTVDAAPLVVAVGLLFGEVWYELTTTFCFVSGLGFPAAGDGLWGGDGLSMDVVSPEGTLREEGETAFLALVGLLALKVTFVVTMEPCLVVVLLMTGLFL